MRYAMFSLMLLVLCLAGVAPTRADDKKAPPPLDAKLRVKVDAAKLGPSCQFDLPGKADQSFQNTEYRYAVLDKDGVQVEDALIFQLPLRTISLPKDKRSVTDATDAKFVKEKLKPGEEYYFVVSVRNLTGLAKFKVGEVPPAEYSAVQKDKKVTVFAKGENPTTGWKNELTVLPIDIYPPEFRFTQIKPTGIETRVFTPFAVEVSVPAPTKIEHVFVTDAAGKHKVPVSQGK